MSSILNASAPTSFEIKSANLPLVALLLKSTDLEQLARELAQRFGDMPDFFDNDPLVVDLSPLGAIGDEGLSTALDFSALMEVLREYRLNPLAVRGGSEVQTEAALGAGLILAQDAMVQRSVPQFEASPEPAQQPVQAPPAEAATAQPAAVPALAAMVIDKPLRSGQQVYARGRDLVVMAMVNPGAEVIADGHIHVYAPLRGKAIAGARGNAEARIFALVMEPELISIAGIYRTSENPLPETVQGKTAQVALMPGDDGTDKLVIKAIGL
jgi:septum site-determining protein MinC